MALLLITRREKQPSPAVKPLTQKGSNPVGIRGKTFGINSI
jgi:hypothetical protein